MKLHPKEAELINKIRNRYNYGDISISCLHGLPYSINRTTTLDKNSISTEKDLIEKIKNTYQWGEITIVCKNGKINRVKKTITYEVL